MSENNKQVWASAVASLVERNATVELTPKTPDGLRRYVRCRLLAAEGDELLVERPAERSVAELFAQGGEVAVTLLHEEKRWEGQCRVLGNEMFRLNASMELRVLRLSGPERIASGQRRDFFRVAIGAGEASLELLNDGAEDDIKSAPPDLKPTLLNLSGGGVGVSVKLTPEATRALRASRTYRCMLHLPEQPDPVELKAKVVHLEPMPDGRVYLGLAFVFDSQTQRQRVQDLLARAATHIQRRQLRRRRRA